jgi:hypothetical protein
MTEKRQTSQGYIIRILQHFATKLRNITNFVMLFQAVMKFLSRLVYRSKVPSKGERSIVYHNVRQQMFSQIHIFIFSKSTSFIFDLHRKFLFLEFAARKRNIFSRPATGASCSVKRGLALILG